VCPTRFQAAQFPDWIRSRLTVVHDGIDTELHSPGDGGRAILARWGVPADAEVLTSITRGMEPHRGFPEIMRALAALQKRRPRLHALIGGEDRVAYGAQLPAGESWKQRMLAELDLDLTRVHFTGLLPRRDMVEVMRASDVHVYLTVPFVLSWSLLDAMSVGCLVVASDTEPVREFLADGRTGLLCPLNDWQALAARAEQALDAPEAHAGLRRRARASIVDTLDARRVVYPRKLKWLSGMMATERSPQRPARPGPTRRRPRA
jgi:glycosyltransferase involved in cell wall biosynthesis